MEGFLAAGKEFELGGLVQEEERGATGDEADPASDEEEHRQVPPLGQRRPAAVQQEVERLRREADMCAEQQATAVVAVE